VVGAANIIFGAAKITTLFLSFQIFFVLFLQLRFNALSVLEIFYDLLFFDAAMSYGRWQVELQWQAFCK